MSGWGQFLIGLDISLPLKKMIRLLNLYNTPRTFPGVEIFRMWLSIQNLRRVLSIICMDANLHHLHWNPPGAGLTHRQARDLLDICGKHGFHLASSYLSKGEGFTIDMMWMNCLASNMLVKASISVENHG